MGTYTNKFPISFEAKIKDFFASKNCIFEPQQYAFFRAKTKDFVAIFYNSGKFLIQGKEISSIVEDFEKEFGIEGNTFESATTNPNKANHSYTKYIGVDESGKGDFFGPLVIAGVMVTPQNKDLFIKLGVKDSKKLNDTAIKKMAFEIQKNSVHSIVVIGNEKYNQLYEKFKNLNKLLAWGHARVIENILEKEECEYAISDKFGKDSFIQNALLERGQKIKLDQFHKGEEDIAVAAASIIARAEFVNRMKSMEIKYNCLFQKGASETVIEQAKLFCKTYGNNRLNEVAKLHFKTTEKVN